jgi:hypothetical protein
MNGAVSSLEGGISTDYLLTDEANITIDLPRAGISLTNTSTSRYGEAPHSIVENILVNYIKLKDPLGRYGYRSKQANIMTKVEEI